MVYDKGAPLDNCWGSVDGALCAISCPGIHKQFCIIVIKDNMHGNFNHCGTQWSHCKFIWTSKGQET